MNVKNPLVSVVIAVYNGEKYLDECIRSVVDQTYRDIEIILINDGSNDGSGKICDGWARKDSRIIVIHQKNQGVSATRNVGIKKAKGEFLCLIDQDDFVNRKYVEYLLGLATDNSAEIATIPNVVFHTDDGDFYLDKGKAGTHDLWDGRATACNMLCGKMEIGPWNKIISMRLLREKKILFHEDLFGGEGYVFSVESFYNAKRVAVGYEGMYYYRVDNSESEMSRYRPRTLRSSIMAMDIMERDFSSDKKVLRAVKFARWRVYVSFLHAIIASGTEKKYIEDYKILKKYCRLYAYRNIFGSVSLKMKIKGFLYILAPVLITKYDLRDGPMRKFNKKESMSGQ